MTANITGMIFIMRARIGSMPVVGVRYWCDDHGGAVEQWQHEVGVGSGEVLQPAHEGRLAQLDAPSSTQ